MFTMVKFSEQLDAELKKKGWTRAELARRAHVNQSTISMAYSGQRNVGPDLFEAIAHGFGDIPVDDVFRVAGLLPPISKELSQLGELTYLIDMLDDDNLQEVIDYARHRLEKQEGKSKRAGREPRLELR